MTRIIRIVPYRQAWPGEFERIASSLRDALGPLALGIDHIGSTSVPGLDAKDIIDVQVTVAALDASVLSGALAPKGYAIRPGVTRDHVPAGWNPDLAEWSKLYFRPPATMRPMHLHVRELGRANQRYALLFRDYLRSSRTAAASYASIKRELARLHPDDIDAYLSVKDPVCDLIVDSAERWARETGWLAGGARE